MNKFTTIYILRHGQSESNAVNTNPFDIENKYGKTGSPLSNLGLIQANKIAQQLKPIHFDAIFSSDLKRAEQTAEIIADAKNMKAQTVTNIHERIYGDKFNKLLKIEQKKLELALFDLNEEERFIHKFSPDGESAIDAVNRFLKFLSEIISLYIGKTILVVNHGNTMRMLLINLGWVKFNQLPPGSIINTGYYILETDGKKFTIKETWGVNIKQTD
jgi:broad specificity phosphatase PhoE